MHRFIPWLVALWLLALPAGASPQLLSERVDGLSRVCTYAGQTNVLNRTPSREFRVGVGQSCPFSYPSQQIGALPAPPTAQLRSEAVTATGRSCSYEQGGTSWAISLPVAQSCPLYAGMIDRSPTRRRPLSSADDPLAAQPGNRQ